VPTQPPHFGAQPSDAYTSQTRTEPFNVAMDARMATSVNTLQEQTIIHDSRAYGARIEDFYTPKLKQGVEVQMPRRYLVAQDRWVNGGRLSLESIQEALATLGGDFALRFEAAVERSPGVWQPSPGCRRANEFTFKLQKICYV
jgi:hypothetical protein